MRRYDFEAEYLSDLKRFRDMDVEVLRGYAVKLLETGDMESFYRVVLGNKAYIEATFTRIEGSVYVDVLQRAIETFSDPLSEDELHISAMLWAASHIYENRAGGYGYLAPDIQTLVWLGRTTEVLNIVGRSGSGDGYKSAGSEAFAEYGEMDVALQLLDMIEDANRRDSLMASVAKLLGEQSRFQEAIDLLRQINRPIQKSLAASQIAQYIVKADLHTARQVLKLGIEAARQIEEPQPADEIQERLVHGFEFALAALDVYENGADLQGVLERAKRIDHAGYRSGGLWEVARWLHYLGDSRCIDVSEELLTDARCVDDAEMRAWAMTMALQSYIEFQLKDTDINGIFGEFWEAVGKIENFFSRRRLLHACATLLAENGYFQHALHCTRNINHDIYITDTLQPVLYEMALAGEAQEAIDIAHDYDGLTRSLCLSQIALALAKNGHHDGAEAALSESVEHHRLYDQFGLSRNIKSFVPVAKLLGQSGRLEDALELVQTGIEVDLRYSQKDDEYVTFRKGWDREKIAYALVESGDFDTALSLMEDSRDSERNQLMRDIVIVHARNGHIDEAKTMLGQMNPVHYYFNEAHAAIGVQYAKHGQLEQAYEVARQLEQRESADGSQANDFFQGILLAAMRGALEGSGNPDGDEIEAKYRGEFEAYNQSEEGQAALSDFEISVKISETQYQTDVYVAIAADLVEKGELEKALAIVRGFKYPQHRAEGLATVVTAAGKPLATILYEAFENAKTVRDEKDRRATIKKVLTAFYETGQGETALEIVRGLENHLDRALLLGHLAALYGKDELVEIDGLLEEAIESAFKVAEHHHQHGTLRAIVETLCKAGLTDYAATIAPRIEWQNNEADRLFAHEYIAYAYAKQKRYIAAFNMLNQHKHAKENPNSVLSAQWFLFTVAEWKLPLAVVLDVMRITSWEVPQWGKVYERLKV